MTNSDETIYRIKVENNHPVFADEDKLFLLDEIENREGTIQNLLRYITDNTVNRPDWIMNLISEYGM